MFVTRWELISEEAESIIRFADLLDLVPVRLLMPGAATEAGMPAGRTDDSDIVPFVSPKGVSMELFVFAVAF